jgi:hypothetical protein
VEKQDIEVGTALILMDQGTKIKIKITKTGIRIGIRAKTIRL